MSANVSGDLQMLDLLLTSGADINARDSMYGETALHWAARKGDPTAVRYLIDHDADVSLPSCPNGDTPLHILCQSDKDDSFCGIAQMLIDNGADVNVSIPKWRHNHEGALHIAVRRNLTNMTRLLLNIPSVDTELLNWNNETPLRIAIKSGNEALQLMLIERGCCISQVIDGHSDLTYTLQFGAHQLAAFLLSHGAEVKSKKCEDPLHVLFNNVFPSDIANCPTLMCLVEKLLIGGASVGKLQEPTSPLSKAVSAGEKNLIELMLAYTEDQPSSLFRLCTLTIRAQLRLATRGRSTQDHLQQLPLPNVIREQLQFKCM